MAPTTDWRATLRRTLPLFGHRNWVVVADAAYPAQVGAVEVVATGEEHGAVLGEVLSALRDATHVRPIARLDLELNALTEEIAPGVEALRAELGALLADLTPVPELHAELLRQLGTAAGSFRVLVLKTSSRVPYSSVFFELDCGYWDPHRERVLRSRLG